MKARLWKGPFSGKVMEGAGPTVLFFRGDKPMTRKQRYEALSEAYKNQYLSYSPTGAFKPRLPQVEATYRMCIRRGYSGNEPFTHPDGSIFYEFVSKRELP